MQTEIINSLIIILNDALLTIALRYMRMFVVICRRLFQHVFLRNTRRKIKRQ